MKAIIQTRYRDIPWADVKKFHGGMAPDSIDWEDVRGRAVSIYIPAEPDTDYCGGPWFRIASGPSKAYWVCQHLAEIGD